MMSSDQPTHGQSRSVARSFAAGVLLGIIVGAAEAAWIAFRRDELSDNAILWWAPLVYGLAFGAGGAAIAVVLRWTLYRRTASNRPLWQAAFGVLIAVTVLTVVRWRLYLDFWDEIRAYRYAVDGCLLVSAVLLGVAAYWLAGKIKLTRLALAAFIALAVSASLSLVPVRHAREIPVHDVAGATGPNVVLIVADTLRADFLRLYDSDAAAATPGIDALAADSVLFRHTVAQSSWTKPSFGSIFTSTCPSAHTATTPLHPLPDGSITLAQVLRDSGYRTLGMSNCNPNNSMRMNFDQGFDYFEDIAPRGFDFGVPASAKLLSLYDKVVRKVRTRLAPDYVFAEHYYLRAGAITDIALDWIDTQTERDRPFFFVVHYMDPHDPYMSGRAAGTGYTFRNHEADGIQDELVSQFVDAYNGDIEYMDKHVHRFLEGLRDRELYEDAIIALTSDHGEEFLDHGHLAHGTTLYEEVISVPLLIKLPKNAGAGQTNDDLAQHIDIAPTLLTLTNTAVPETMQGHALLDLSGQSFNSAGRYAISETQMNLVDLAALRTASEKLILNNAGRGDTEPIELYDLSTDPQEQNNLAETRRTAAATLRAQLTAYLARNRNDAGHDDTHKPPASVTDQLKALGYLE